MSHTAHCIVKYIHENQANTFIYIYYEIKYIYFKCIAQ